MRLLVEKCFPRLCLGAAWFLFVGVTQALNQSNLEQSVCGLKEPFYFWLWQRVAGKADRRRVAEIEGAEDISFRTVDGRALWGYRLRARANPAHDGDARGFRLIAPGNAMLSAQVLGAFGSFAQAGLDVYLYVLPGLWSLRGQESAAGHRQRLPGDRLTPCRGALP